MERGMKKRNLVLVGLGGIGRWVVQALPGVLGASEDDWEITLVDGDKYDQSNVPRQCGPEDVGKYKAIVWALKMPEIYSVFPDCVYVHDSYCFEENSIVLLAVDNHKTRKLVSDKVSQLKNAVLISGGNELTDGNVQLYVRRKGKDLTAPLGKFHPEIENPTDRAPFEKSCEELSVHESQITATNMSAAAIMVCYLTAFVLNVNAKPVYGETYFDISTTTAVSKVRGG